MLDLQASAGADLEFLRALALTRSFTNGTPQSLQLTPDGRSALFLRGQPRENALRLYLFDLESGRERELASAGSVLGGAGETLSPEERARRERMRITARGIVGYQLARDGSFALFMLGGRAFAIPLAGGPARELAGPDAEGNPIFDPQLSPDGSRCAFVRAGELWCVPVLPGAEAQQLTRGASATLLHARAEFVAQEELARFRGFWWSPDSSALLYEEVDESAVEQLFLIDPAHEFRAPAPQAYPRAGRANARCRFGIVPAAGGETRWLQLDRQWEYVARVEWPAPDALLLIALSRDQRDLALLAFAGEGAPRTLVRERDEAFLNSARDLVWLPDGRGFLWSSDASGELQLFHRSTSGEPLRALTPRDFRYSALLGLDAAATSLFVLRHPTPLASELWELPLPDERSSAPVAPPRRLAPDDAGSAGGESVTAVFARRGRAHARIISPANGPPRFELHAADGRAAGALRSLAERPPLEPRIELAQVGVALLDRGAPAPDGGLHSLLVRPRDFAAGRRYPLLVQVYGGPHVNTVRRSAAGYVLDQWIADHGFLVLRVDNRGTPLRGRDFERAIAGRFAEVPLDDQIAAVQAWCGREPAIDPKRVGIIGHSFGGFVAALAVLKRPDVFAAAVAGAPVVDWMNYDTAYTERYLGVPPPEGNELYSSNGLLRTVDQPGLAARPLLISHGTADDNVHFSESLLLCDALFRAGKPFEFLPQLGQTHQFHQPELMVRYWERIFAFFQRHLAA